MRLDFNRAISHSSKVRERLRRLEWIYERAPIYFVTACTDQRRRILASDEVHTALVKFGIEGQKRGAWIGAYVLMPDHLHAFVAVDDERISVSMWIKSLKNALSKILRARQVQSPHWQKGFFDHVLRNGESYSGKWHYVRENPIRAGLASKWDDWPYQGELFPLEFRNDRM